jgi:hypothetical protein
MQIICDRYCTLFASKLQIDTTSCNQTLTHICLIFVCVGVMYSGEYDVRDVTLSVHPRRPSFSKFA